MAPSTSSEEKAQWFLRLAKTSNVFSQGGGELGGASVMEIIWGQSCASRQFVDAFGGYNVHQIIQQLLVSSANNEEVAAAMVVGAVILMEKSSTQPWDPELAGAVLGALRRIATPPTFMDLPRVYLSCLKSYGPRASPALLTQLLSLPYMSTALKAMRAYPLLEETLAARSLAELEHLELGGQELGASSALELLHLSRSFGVGLDAKIYQRVMVGCIDTKQLDLAISAVSSFFKASHLKATVPSAYILRNLVSMPSSQPSVFLQLCDADRLITFASELLLVGALENAQPWALAAAREAADQDISVPPEVVSALAEVFLPQPPQQQQGPEAAAANGGSGDGVEATVIAFKLMLEAQQQAPSEQLVRVDAAVPSAATQRSPSGFGTQPSQPSASPQRGKQAITATKKPARAKLDSARAPDRPKVRKGGDGSWRSLSSPAKVRIAGLLLSSSDPALLRYRPLALEMAPSQEVAAQLLAYYQPRLGSEYPPGLLANVLGLAKGRGDWRSLGIPCISALRQLPRDQQVSELAGGGAAALCQLLLHDVVAPSGLAAAAGGAALEGAALLDLLLLREAAAPSGLAAAAAGPAAGEGPAPLDLLLDFLCEFCCIGANSSSGSTASVGTFTYPDWHDLVLRLLALCEGQQGDRASPLVRASPLIRQVVRILGIAATEAAGRDKRLAETVWIVQQVRQSNGIMLTYCDVPDPFASSLLLIYQSSPSLIFAHSLPPPHTQALIGPQRTARQPSVLLVARLMLEGLQGCDWMLPVAAGSSDSGVMTAPSDAVAASVPVAGASAPAAAASTAVGLRAIDESVRAYAGLLSWCAKLQAIAAPQGADAGLRSSLGEADEGLRSWLLPLLAELCDSLSASPFVGAKWAKLLSCPEAGFLFLSRLCIEQGFCEPVVDLVTAFQNSNPGKKVRMHWCTKRAGQKSRGREIQAEERGRLGLHISRQ